MSAKELLTIEFRYYDKPVNNDMAGYMTKTSTIGVFDTLEEAVIAGNNALKELSSTFELRSKDKFEINGLVGSPKRLVTNTCYPTKGIEYFAKITKLYFAGIVETVRETLNAFERYKTFKLQQ